MVTLELSDYDYQLLLLTLEAAEALSDRGRWDLIGCERLADDIRLQRARQEMAKSGKKPTKSTRCRGASDTQ